MARLFISHRGADADAATRLARDLETRGHVVRLDTTELLVGDSIPEWMNAALADVDFVLLCLSTWGVDAPWITREWFSTLARQLNGEGIRLLPVRLTGGTLPPILADIKYADAVTDWASAIDAIDRAVMRR